MKKKLALLLALVMVLALVFVGCDKNKDDDDNDKDSNTKTTTEAATTTVPPSTEELVIGKWSATADFADLMAQSMGEMEGAEYMEFSDFNIKYIYEFKADNTCEISIDDDIFAESVDNFIDQMIDGQNAYYEAEYGMSLEAALEASGAMTIEDYKAFMTAMMDFEAMKDEMTFSGTYSVEGDKITVTRENDEKEVLEYAADALKIVEVVESDKAAEDIIKAMTFKK